MYIINVINKNNIQMPKRKRMNETQFYKLLIMKKKLNPKT